MRNVEKAQQDVKQGGENSRQHTPAEFAVFIPLFFSLDPSPPDAVSIELRRHADRPSLP